MMTERIVVCKADSIRRKGETQGVTLCIINKIPKFTENEHLLDAWKEYADQEADRVVFALSHLPQGVLDRVLLALMARQVGLYQGSHWLDREARNARLSELINKIEREELAHDQEGRME